MFYVLAVFVGFLLGAFAALAVFAIKADDNRPLRATLRAPE